ncbi:hypothetical protein EAJ17_01385 [Akkermansia sp. aa_0143]|nr:hypothetical protein EAJ17_01385 [Akkermansia sp. aa_0143]
MPPEIRLETLLFSLLILFFRRNMRHKPCCSWRQTPPLTASLLPHSLKRGAFFIRCAGIRRERDEKG